MRYATNDTKKILQLQYQKYLNEISGIFKLEKSRNIADFYHFNRETRIIRPKFTCFDYRLN